MIKKILIIISFFNLVIAKPSEFISLWNSDITINKDRSIFIKETIIYELDANLQKRGIFKDITTNYKDRLGNFVKIKLDIRNILKDNNSVPYDIIAYWWGKRIKIGDPKVYLLKGSHKYQISYTINRHIGFYKAFDEFAWDVIGTNFQLPVLKVIASVNLPSDIPRNKINMEAYTGYIGQKGSDYKSYFDEYGRAVFESTKPFNPRQNITIVVNWPKGYIKAPTTEEKIKDLLFDNLHVIWFIFCILSLLVSSLYIWLNFRKTQKQEIVIPLFEPPSNLSPGAIAYINKRNFSAVSIAANIVDLAVKGFVKIENKKNFFTESYLIHKEKKEINNLANDQTIILTSYFKKADSITIERKNSDILSLVNNSINHYYNTWFGDKYFDNNGEYTVWATIGGLICFLPLILLSSDIANASSTYIFAGIYIIIFLIFYFLLKGYTKEGVKIKAAIDGFKMFLQATEQERLKFVGTPPTQNPELYEKFLPYAIALGVEFQWTKQFASVFAKYAQEHHPYKPRWIVGPGFRANLFANSFARNLTSNIASASRIYTNAPGSTSSSGGGGYSGGGGGSRGGGSW